MEEKVPVDEETDRPFAEGIFAFPEFGQDGQPSCLSEVVGDDFDAACLDNGEGGLGLLNGFGTVGRLQMDGLSIAIREFQKDTRCLCPASIFYIARLLSV